MQVIRLNKKTHDGIYQQIAIIHENLLAEGVLAKLGSNFLMKLYKALVNDSEAAVYVIQENEKILAFVSCTTNTNNFYKQFIYSNWTSMILILPKLCTPILLKRSFSLLKYLIKKTDNETPVAELLSIAVAKDAHRVGLGSKLMTKVFDFMKENHVDSFKVTAALTQKSAHKFYESKGGISMESIELGKLKSYIYHFTIFR